MSNTNLRNRDTNHGADGFVDGVLHGADKSLRASLLRAALTPLSLLHQIGLEAFLFTYKIGLLRQHRLRRTDGSPVPVVGIGNLTSGGTGKTPMAALVAGGLRDRGHKVVLLSRGHGGANEYRDGGRSVAVVHDGTNVRLGAEEAGDEPRLLAQILGDVPLLVGKDRRESGRVAVARFAPDVVVLDDALQFRELYRDLDIALLDARHPFDNGFLIPRGLLREPPAHLRKAKIVVLTRADRASPAQLADAQTRARRHAPRAALFTATHAPVGWVTGEGEILPLGALGNRRVLLFSGIADGGAFAQTARDLGVNIEYRWDFGDHYKYTPDDVRVLCDIPGVEAAVTTEKDWVKIAPPVWNRDAVPLHALRIVMQTNDDAGLLNEIEAVMRRVK